MIVMVEEVWDARKELIFNSRFAACDWRGGRGKWTHRGLTYDPTTDFVRFTDGILNHLNIMKRPGVVLENGHMAYFTFAVIDVPKWEEKGNDNHDSKILVVPFDSAALDHDLQNTPKTTPPVASPANPPAQPK